MDRFRAMQIFVRVVETGSFSRAASTLGMTQPTATKAIAAAERRLRARLLHRSTHGVAPTAAGSMYYGRCKAILRDLEDAENVAAAAQVGTGGILRVNSSVAFGQRVLVPLVLRYMAEFPALQIDLGIEDRYVDLVEQGVDLAIRMGTLDDSSLGARHVGINPWVLAAAPVYLAQRGSPADPADLAQHTCLIYSTVQGDARWLLRDADGRDVSVPVRGPLRTNALSAILDACCAGMGLAVMPRYVAREAIAAGRIVPVLARLALPAQEMHAVFPSPKLVPAKVTAFIGWLQKQLDGPWWTRAL